MYRILGGVSFAGVLALLAAAASAQLVGNPAGPRTGLVYELHVSPPSAPVLGELNRLGFNVGHVTRDYAEVFATQGEYDYLAANGYSVTVAGTQPNPPVVPRAEPRGLGVYHTYASLTTDLQTYAASYPAITKLVSLGGSVQGRKLWAMIISDNPTLDEEEPEFKYVSTMHGDEPVGTEMCVYLIDHLLTNYGIDSRVTDLVNETKIWIVPLMNPDGLEAGTRNNANGFDLNRSFPNFPEDYSMTAANLAPNLSGLQPEVQILMAWAYAHRFVLSANLHTGEVVASYPYDAAPGVPDMTPALTPDHALFVDLATAYASNNPPMAANNSPPFQNGIVNGNHWFIVEGGMQDWMYRFMGDAEITLELAIPKKPPQGQLATYWANNQESMLSYLEWVHRGVRGVVTDSGTSDPLNATVRVLGNPQLVFSDPDVGDYYRLLRPGTYALKFESVGYEPVTVTNVVVTSGAATRVDVALTPMAGLPGPGRYGALLAGVAIALLGCATLLARRGKRNTRGGTH